MDYRINNNGATAANAGNLSTSTVQTGAIINETQILTTNQFRVKDRIENFYQDSTYLDIGINQIDLVLNQEPILVASYLGAGTGFDHQIVFNQGSSDFKLHFQLGQDHYSGAWIS